MINVTLLDSLPEWAAVRPTYETWAALMQNEIDFSHEASVIHTKAHCARVICYALLIAARLGLDADAMDVLGAAGAFHDCRRQDDGPDVGHGARAATAYRTYCRKHDRPYYDERVFQIMTYHDLDDARGEQVLSGSDLLLYRVFKVADALDRWRLGPKGLDPAYLRTEPARALVEFSKLLTGVADAPPESPFSA